MEQVRKITKLPNTLRNFLKTEPQLGVKYLNDHQFCHSELFCSKCESLINQSVTYEAFDSYSGFIGIHETQYGKCVVSIYPSSARKITAHLVTLRNCENCNNCTKCPSLPNVRVWTH